jgi:predicted Zn-dependent protease
VLNPYVQRVFDHIRQANPQLPPVQLVLSRNPEPNAHAVGNSTVMLNVGLLGRLENESQLAYILCHELAHVQPSTCRPACTSSSPIFTAKRCGARCGALWPTNTT